MNTSENQTDNQWNTYWNNEGAKGEVFVGADGSAHPELSDWWRSQFSTCGQSSDVVDLACGAGSVFTHLPDNHGHRLFGADISAEALTLMRERVPGVTTTVCSADSLPYEDGQFDVVCSQFGVEYAGQKAFTEAARVLGKAGKLWILCHIEDGFIDSRNRAHLDSARSITESQFIPRALELTRATFSGQKTQSDQATQAFIPAERQLAKTCKNFPTGIHLHLYNGFRKLYENRQHYHQADIEQWLTQMETDVEHNIQRLQHMRQAASDQSAMNAVVEALKASGCTDIQCQALQLQKHPLPVAWALTATR